MRCSTTSLTFTSNSPIHKDQMKYEKSLKNLVFWLGHGCRNNNTRCCRLHSHTLAACRCLSDTIKRGTLSKNRKNCLDLVNIEAKRQPRGLGRFSDSPEAHPTRPRTRYRFSASPEAPPERPRTRYRFSVSLEAGSASAPPQL